MGLLSELQLNEKETIYCPKAGRMVEITKWYLGGGKDIGDLDAYVLICQEPWKAGEEKIKTHNVKKVVDVKNINVPCGEDRRCKVLYKLWLMEKELDSLLENTDFTSVAKELILDAVTAAYEGRYESMERCLTRANDSIVKQQTGLGKINDELQKFKDGRRWG